MIPALVKQAGGTVQDHSWLHSVFEFSMGCMRLVSREKNEKKTTTNKDNRIQGNCTCLWALGFDAIVSFEKHSFFLGYGWQVYLLCSLCLAVLTEQT